MSCRDHSVVEFHGTVQTFDTDGHRVRSVEVFLENERETFGFEDGVHDFDALAHGEGGTFQFMN
jgi:hypothetical protein